MEGVKHVYFIKYASQYIFKQQHTHTRAVREQITRAREWDGGKEDQTEGS